jgi:hypothetical protein
VHVQATSTEFPVDLKVSGGEKVDACAFCSLEGRALLAEADGASPSVEVTVPRDGILEVNVSAMGRASMRGSYEVSLRSVAPPSPEEAWIRPITLGGEVQGTLDELDEGSGNWAAGYYFEGLEGSEIEVRIDSDDIGTPFLAIALIRDGEVSGEGAIFGQPGGLSRTGILPEWGTWAIVVGNLDSGQKGSFSLFTKVR